MTARVVTERDASPELTGTVVGSERIEAGGMATRCDGRARGAV